MGDSIVGRGAVVAAVAILCTDRLKGEDREAGGPEPCRGETGDAYEGEEGSAPSSRSGVNERPSESLKLFSLGIVPRKQEE